MNPSLDLFVQPKSYVLPSPHCSPLTCIESFGSVHRRLKVAGQLFSNRVPSSVGEWFSDSPDSREMAWTLLAELDEPCLLRCIALHPLRDSSQKLDAWRLLKLVYSYSNDICPVGLQLSIHVLLPHIFSFFFFIWSCLSAPLECVLRPGRNDWCYGKELGREEDLHDDMADAIGQLLMVAQFSVRRQSYLYALDKEINELNCT